MAHTYRFGEVEILPDERRMLVGGNPATVSARAFDVLAALVERRDRIVTKAELLDVVWPGLVVEENNLQVHISALRKLLGRNAIATVPGRGYRFTMAGDGATAPSAASEGLPTVGVGNLGSAVESLVGRETDLAEASESLARSRLVTLVGAGGVGKSRLAREIGREQAAGYPDGVWWVDLAKVTVEKDIAPAIAAAAAMQLGAGDATAALGRALAPRRMMLVLDNCEHLVEAVASIASELLARAPGLRLLATSQASLRVQGEVLHRVEPLAVPPAQCSLDEARDRGSVALFERRVRALDRRFQVDSANVSDVVSICRQLDGLPLAIEMAAARAPLMGTAALAARLGERLNLLRGNHRDAAARHETLRATLDWSHALLEPQEQAVLRRLAVFRGSFRLDVAQGVCTDAGLDEWAVLDALDVLVDRSLVQVESGARYRLLETTRLYAVEKLKEAGELAAWRARHARAMTRLSAEVLEAFRSEPDKECVQRYMHDFADLSTACELAVADADAVTAAWTGDALMHIDTYRNIYSDIPRRKSMLHSLLPAADPAIHARLWSCLTAARSLPLSGMSKREACDADVAAWRQANDRVGLYGALSRAATAWASSGDGASALERLAEAKALEDAAWTPQVRLIGAFNTCLVFAFSDDTDEFSRVIEEEARLAESARSHRFRGNVELFRAEVAMRRGQAREALERTRPFLEIRGREHLLGYSTFAAVACQALVALGRTAEATDLAARQLPLAEANGVSAWFCDVMAVGAARGGNPGKAAQWLARADAAYAAAQEVRRMQDRVLEGEARAALTAAGVTIKDS